MKRTVASYGLEDLHDVISRTSLPGEALPSVLLYEDAQTLAWAKGAHRQVELSGRQVRATWWKLGELHHPGVLAGAVSTALRADLVVVALRGDAGLPLPYYIWVNTWLAGRPRGLGTLVSLLGEASARTAQSEQVRKYLQTVALESAMSFIFETRPLEPALPKSTLIAPVPRRDRFAFPLPDAPTIHGGVAGRRRTQTRRAGWSEPAKAGLARWAGI